MSAAQPGQPVPGGDRRLRVSHDGRTAVLDGPTVTFGRDARCEVVVSHEDVSRRHAELRLSGEGWFLVDVGSTNGTWMGGQRVSHVRLPDAGASFRLGGRNGPLVEVTPAAAGERATVQQPGPHPGPAPAQQQGLQQPPPATPPYGMPPQGPPQGFAPQGPPQQGWAQPPAAQQGWGQGAAPAAPAAQQGWPGAGQASGPRMAPPGLMEHGRTILPDSRPQGMATLTIGRSRTSDVFLDDPLVSRQHATLELGAMQPVLRDLGSFNGTHVNGRRIQGPVPLSGGDEVAIGNQTFVWDGYQLVSRASRSDLTLGVEGLTQVVKGGKRLLDNVSFQLEPATLTGVVGPSGSGKSTLLGALTGLNPASHGNVVWQGHDLYTHYEQLRFQIGLVPQQDIQHPQLTVRQGLSYAAMLRLPPDTGKEERDERVGQVVGRMQLQRQVDNRIGTQLSGGQKKRVSIATELLTAPPLLFLDEPTSGLDPGLDRDVMLQLRDLSDEGRVVVVVTHSVLALDTCDNVIVLAPGGRLAYFGPPSGVLAHFGCNNYPEVFDLLDEPDLWQRIPPPPGVMHTGGMPALANSPVTPPPPQSLSRQLTTLVRRNLALTVSDRLLLAMLVMMPLVLGGLSRLVQGDAGMSLEENNFGVAEVQQRLTILIVAAALMGVAVTIREQIKERAIFKREYAVGLSPGVYLASKILVLGTACFLQGVLVTFIATVGLPGPDDGGVLGLGRLEITFAIGALAFTMAVAGLAFSALVTSSEQTMPILVGLVMVQLVLSGALFAVDDRPILEQAAWLSPSRWAFSAAASSVDIHGPLERRPGETPDPLYSDTVGQYLGNILMLGVLCAATIVIAFVLTRRSATAPDR
ncbi:FHA domain-containing protein [Nocardioides sp. CFH 31398]|uniref:FHA domain-containing protein n=1 Tax=Nocardioides sp. CFH 31398 TaxID=2919579 RepID=UPI001F06C016|nr:FHA domain-containing protein [Nocardioides sp. CFH 31398]MCH1868898.1 FHA domain-containing protein [Nocardioides sp. CFH 31398]